MKHFAIEDWADLVHGLVADEKRAAMKGHLDDGCDTCAAHFHICERVAHIAINESSYEPPEGIVRSVKALFALQAPTTESARNIKIARLIFDSFRQPVPVGVRAFGQPSRQVLFKAGRYYIDLRIERQAGKSQSSLVGQVLRHPGAPPDTGQLDVRLTRGKTPISNTVTNRLGEFHFELDATKNHEISISVEEDSSITVPLRGTQRS